MPVTSSSIQSLLHSSRSFWMFVCLCLGFQIDLFYRRFMDQNIWFLICLMLTTSSSHLNFIFCWACISVQLVVITNLTHFLMCVYIYIYIFHFSTCSKQPSVHQKKNQLYQYIICLVCRSDRNIRQSPTQSETYQMMCWYNWFSWWWALGCSKHVEKWNK